MNYTTKKYYIFFILTATFLLFGCNSLDVENTSSLDVKLIWNNEKTANAYVTNLYAAVFNNWSHTADIDSEQISGNPFYESSINLIEDKYKKWNYTTIWSINDGLERLGKSTLEIDVINSLKAQMLFMRAYLYSEMVFLHGGVPYITKPQDKDKDDLYVFRNSTKECFDFMIEDLDSSISLLPEKIGAVSEDYGRIDQCFAKSFKAKVLLYKASPQFNPISGYDNKYWEEAYLAAKEAYEFCLQQGSELILDYKDIWLKERGREVLFAVVNTYPELVADRERYIRPGSLSTDPARNPPTWNLVRQFPMADGKSFNDATGKYYVQDESTLLQVFWKNRDPRFYNSILFNASFYNVSGTVDGYRQYTALGVANLEDAYGTNPNAEINATNNDFSTGFYILKASDLSLSQSKVLTYSVDYILMRFAELMLIYAESANEIGDQSMAIELLRQLRTRAGIEPGDDFLFGLDVSSKESLRKAILNERNIELCFEGHRFMDLRRTRNMMTLNGLTKAGVEAIAINDDGTDMGLSEAKEKAKKNELNPENFRYILHQVPLSKNEEKEFVIKESYYFFPIQQSVINENPNIAQNKDWGGTFNPALE